MPRWILTLIAVLFVAHPALAALSPRSVVTLYGIDALRMGGSVAQAQTILGVKFGKKELHPDGNCGYVSPLGGPQGVSFMVWGQKVVRVDISEDGAGKASSLATQSGIHIGSTEAQVKQQYPGRLKIEPHPYGDADDHYLRMEPHDPADKQFLLIFETMDGVVTSFRSGLREAVELIEGCS